MSAPVVIKKYGNRRLYDTGESRYVTLDELAAKIRSGLDIRVVDAQTNDDLTQATLTQLVLETGNAAKFLPVQLLTQMIRLSDDSLAEFFSRYVTNALDMYLQAKRGVATLASYNPLAQIPTAASDALARMWMSTPFASYPPAPSAAPAPPAGYNYPVGASPYVAPPPGPAAPPEEPPPDTRGSSPEISAMRRELDELKAAIREGLASKPEKKKKKDRS